MDLVQQQEAAEASPKSRAPKREPEPAADVDDEGEEAGTELEASDDEPLVSDDDDGTPEDGEQAEDDDGTEEIEWEDGKKLRVPKGIKDGLMRHADYTRKTQEVAESRRHVEAAKVAVAQQAQIVDRAGLAFAHRQDAVNKLAEIDQKIDFRQLEANDPAKAQSWWRYREQLKEFIGNTTAHIDEAQREIQLIQQQETARRLEYMNRVLPQRVPGWGQKLANEITKTLVEDYGFTNEQCAAIYEPNVVALANDARKWRAHIAKTKTAPKQANKQSAPQPTVQPTEKFSKGTSNATKKPLEKMSTAEYIAHMNAKDQQKRDTRGKFR